MFWMKVKIYQYFGIYLAHKEELKQVWEWYYINGKKSSLGLYIGVWQASVGLTRFAAVKWRGYPKAVQWVAVLLLQLKHDLKKGLRCYRK